MKSYYEEALEILGSARFTSPSKPSTTPSKPKSDLSKEQRHTRRMKNRQAKTARRRNRK